MSKEDKMTDCGEVQEFLSAYDEQAGSADFTRVERHLATCGSCQADKARFEELKLTLGDLSHETIDPPGWLVASITQQVAEKARRIAAINRVKTQVTNPKMLSGGALLAAGVAGLFIVRGRKRRRRKFGTKLRHALAPAA